MKNLFLCIACLFVFNCFGQEVQSLELLKTNMEKFKPIGESNGFLYYYVPNRGAGGLKIEIYKIKESTFELVDRKIVDVEVTGRKVFLNEDNAAMKAYFKNNKFYFFYCMASSGDFYVYLTTMDESFANMKTTEIGVMEGVERNYFGFLYVDLSPDFKSAIVTLKNTCESRSKARIAYTIVYENTELVYVDLINEKIVYSKRLPIELDKLRYMTKDYITDNEGNITFIASIVKREIIAGTIFLSGIGVGYFKKSDETMSVKEIDIKGSKTIYYSIVKNKKGNIFHTQKLNDDVVYKIQPLDKSKKMIEVKGYYLNHVSTDDGNLVENENNFIFLNDNLEEVRKINKKDIFNLPKEASSLTNSREYSLKNKTFFIWGEAKASELSEKDKNTKNTFMCSVDENGIVKTKRLINDNLIYEFDFSSEDYVSDAGNLYTEVWDSKKRILFLKQIPLK